MGMIKMEFTWGLLARFVYVFVMGVFIFGQCSVVGALSSDQKKIYQSGINYFDLEECGASNTENVSPGSGDPEGLTFPNLDPEAMADAIDTYVKKQNPDSKMNGAGKKLVASAEKNNVSPFLVIAIAYMESGLADPSDYNVSHGNNAFGRTATSSQPNFQGAMLWYKWSSVRASVDADAPENKKKGSGGDITKYMRDMYAPMLDKNDLTALITKYGDNVSYYVKQASGWIKEMAELTEKTKTGSSGGGSSTSSESSTSLGSLPAASQKVFDSAKPAIDKLQPLYESAAQKTNLPWEYLAALHYRESNNREGTSLLAGEPLGSVNPDGVTNNGGSDAEANAVAAAEHFIGNAKMVYKVDPTKDQSFEDLQKAFIAYNRGFIYQWGNMDPDKSPYVMSGYDEEHALPMPWPVLPPASNYTEITGSDARLGAMAILAGLGISGGSGECEGDLGQTADGFTFPLITSKQKMQSSGWCYSKKTSCHHDYAAADIFASVGTKVVAALGGTVYKVDDPQCSGGFDSPRVQIKATDGRYYYYTHMKPGSIVIKEGQKISPGDDIGVVGPTECAQGTPPHLHIHRASAPIMCAGTPTCSQHADFDKNDIQPDLVKAYQNLPEK